MNYTELIIKMYKSGISIKKISKTIEIKEVEILECLREHNLLRQQIVDRDESICEMYKAGKKITEIAEEFKIDRHTVTDILKKYDIHNNIRSSLDDKEKEDRNKKIIELYESGKSFRTVSKEVGVCVATVKNVLTHYNIPVRPQHQIGHSKGTSKNRKHFFDEDYFEIIDTEHKAYWLGFLYADGCVTDKGTLTLALQNQDRYMLKLFLKDLKNNGYTISDSKKTKSSRVILASVKTVSDLIEKGCKPNKSLRLLFPTFDQVPEHLIHHFIRGYFDGDGCIYYNEKYKYNPVFSLVGTPEFLTECQKIIDKNIEKQNKIKKRKNKNGSFQTQTLSYGGKQQIIKIFNFLYKDATIYMERKYNKLHSLLSSQDETINNLESTTVELSGEAVKSEDRQSEIEDVLLELVVSDNNDDSNISQTQRIDTDPLTAD